jgi:hypothetical protein
MNPFVCERDVRALVGGMRRSGYKYRILAHLLYVRSIGSLPRYPSPPPIPFLSIVDPKTATTSPVDVRARQRREKGWGWSVCQLYVRT